MPFDPSYLFFISLGDTLHRSLPSVYHHPLIAYPLLAIGLMLLAAPLVVQAVKLGKMVARYRREVRRCRRGD
jgi:hypothetical protein